MKVLIGTTNPSKVKRFKELLDGCEVEFCTPEDLHIESEPEEKGNTPEENAIIKAKFYGQFWDMVICNDSGLYFDSLPLEDERQPGLNIRTPYGDKRLDDEEMITYYANLVHSIGGKVLAFYLDGIAVYNKGWPLDSLSLNRNTLTYFVEKEDNRYDTTRENIMLGEYRKRLIAFLKEALEIE